MDPLTDELRAAVDNLSIGRVPSSSASDPDLAHDYAEIYTPSREKVPWPRAPTPPIHRFPSWEDRIYQVFHWDFLIRVGSECEGRLDVCHKFQKIQVRAAAIFVALYWSSGNRVIYCKT